MSTHNLPIPIKDGTLLWPSMPRFPRMYDLAFTHSPCPRTIDLNHEYEKLMKEVAEKSKNTGVDFCTPWQREREWWKHFSYIHSTGSAAEWVKHETKKSRYTPSDKESSDGPFFSQKRFRGCENPEARLSPESDTKSVGSAESVSSDGSSKETKQFPCDECGSSFRYKHVLQNHKRTHTGERPYKCKICHKDFSRDHHLKTHVRLHTGEKPYKCPVCGKKFVQVANLRRHAQVHSRGANHPMIEAIQEEPEDLSLPARR